MEPPASRNPSRRPLKTRSAGWANALARWLAKLGVRPNAVSVASVFFAAAAGAAFWASGHTSTAPPGVWLVVAAVLIQGRLLCNLLDGMIAIEGGFKTKSGEIYNELPDRFADLLIIGGAGYAADATAWQPELAWLAAGLAVTTAYVRALGVAAGASQKFHGPMAKPHRMALLTVAALVHGGWFFFTESPPALLFWALVVMAAGCLITIYRRCGAIVRELESK
jgi:phosphatidylglycerophosphate synthase